MNKEKALKNQGLEFREDIELLGGMKNAESFIVWTGNVYGDRDRCLDI